ncbi:MAG: hypothetical protein LBN41_05925 [Enterobacteriaceae bacterium]|jgi:hypothetical protein|nr:hypothetical protein [Enterobacteriaceae bacterium]
MEELQDNNFHNDLFMQKIIYQHLHNTALQAAVKGMDDIATNKVVTHNTLFQITSKLTRATVEKTGHNDNRK